MFLNVVLICGNTLSVANVYVPQINIQYVILCLAYNNNCHYLPVQGEEGKENWTILAKVYKPGLDRISDSFPAD